MANSGFLTTDAGLAAASVATPTGPYIHITQIKLGSGVGYTPDRGQTALSGTILWSGTPYSYTIVDSDTVEVLALLDLSIGTFQFGEIGIYLADGTLFAVSVFDALQEKVKAVGLQTGNIWRIRARLKLAQAAAIIQVTVTNTMGVLEVPNWQSLAPPVAQLSGANVVIVHEPNSSDDSILVYRDKDSEWSLSDFVKVFDGNVSSGGGSSTTTSITHPGFVDLSLDMPTIDSRYVIKFEGGAMRRAVNLVGTTMYWNVDVTAPTGNFSVWEDIGSHSNGKVAWASKYEFNNLVTQVNQWWSTPNGPLNEPGAWLSRGLNQVALSQISYRPKLLDWTPLVQAVKSLGYIYQDPAAANVVVDDFIYDPRDNAGYGMVTKANRYSAVTTVINDLASRYEVPGYAVGLVDAESPIPTLTTSSVNMVQTVNQYGAFSFVDEPTLIAQANGGFTFVVSPVLSGGDLASDAFLQEWQSFLSRRVGSIKVERNKCSLTATSTTNQQLGYAYGWDSQTDYSQVFNIQETQSDGQHSLVFVFELRRYLNSVFFHMRFNIVGTPTNNNNSHVTNLVSTFQEFRPTASWVNTPALSFPSVSLSDTVDPTPPVPPQPANVSNRLIFRIGINVDNYVEVTHDVVAQTTTVTNSSGSYALRWTTEIAQLLATEMTNRSVVIAPVLESYAGRSGNGGYTLTNTQLPTSSNHAYKFTISDSAGGSMDYQLAFYASTFSTGYAPTPTSVFVARLNVSFAWWTVVSSGDTSSWVNQPQSFNQYWLPEIGSLSSVSGYLTSLGADNDAFSRVVNVATIHTLQRSGYTNFSLNVVVESSDANFNSWYVPTATTNITPWSHNPTFVLNTGRTYGSPPIGSNGLGGMYPEYVATATLAVYLVMS